MPFKSPAEFKEVMDQAFGLMSTDPDMGPKLREADTPQRFEYPDVDMVATIRAAAKVKDGQNLEWAWGEQGWDYEVEMVMDSEVANRYFQGRENVAMAIARRRIKAGATSRRHWQSSRSPSLSSRCTGNCSPRSTRTSLDPE